MSAMNMRPLKVKNKIAVSSDQGIYRTSLWVAVFLLINVAVLYILYDRLSVLNVQMWAVCMAILGTLLVLKYRRVVSSDIIVYSVPALMVLYVGACMPQFKMEGAFLTPVVIHAMRKVNSIKEFYLISGINILVMGTAFILDHTQYGPDATERVLLSTSSLLMVSGLILSSYELMCLIRDGSLLKWHRGNDDAVKILPEITDANKASLTIQTLFRGLFSNSLDAVEIIQITKITEDNLYGSRIARNREMEKLFEDIPYIIGVDYYLYLLGLDPEAIEDKTSYQEEYITMWNHLYQHGSHRHDMIIHTPHGQKHIESINIIDTIEGQIYMTRIYADITNESAQRMELEKKNQELERYIESNMNLTNFAAVASHDLKAPLRTVSSFAQLMQERYSSDIPEGALKYLDIIQQSTKSMSSLITDLNEYSKIDSKKFNYSDISPQELIDDVSRDIQAEILQSGAHLDTDMMDVSIRGDHIKLIQLLSNLVRNAMKFQKEGTTPEIKISMEDAGSHWRFAVEDNGIGIAEHNQKKIFKIFSRLHTQSQYEGSGLGLATSTKIVDGHHGHIWVESQLYEGATFYFTIRKVLP